MFIDLTGYTGKKHIVVDQAGEHKYLFLVYNSDVELQIDITAEDTQVFCSAIVVSANGIKSNLTFAGNIQASQAKADVYLLSLLGDKAQALVKGGILLDKNITKAEGYLSEENILLGKHIKIKALPMLDVHSSDVKASHGAKIDRLDEQKLFYLSAKGLPRSEAQNLMIHAYIQKALDHAGVEDEELIEAIFQKLND